MANIQNKKYVTKDSSYTKYRKTVSGAKTVYHAKTVSKGKVFSGKKSVSGGKVFSGKKSVSGGKVGKTHASSRYRNNPTYNIKGGKGNGK